MITPVDVVRSGKRINVAAIPAVSRRSTSVLHWVVFPQRSTPSSNTKAPRCFIDDDVVDFCGGIIARRYFYGTRVLLLLVSVANGNASFFITEATKLLHLALYYSLSCVTVRTRQIA